MAKRSSITTLDIGTPSVYLPKPEKRSNPLENPAISLASPAAWSWILNSSPTAAGEVISIDSAMQISTVYTCIRIIAETCASLRLRLFERLNSGRVEAFDNSLHYLLSVQPNIEMSAFSLWETFFGSMAATGNGYAQIERAVSGDPIAIWPLDPRKTKSHRDTSGKLIYLTSDGMSDGKQRVIQPADMIHCPLYSWDGINGLSPIMQAKQSLGLAKAAEKFGAKFFGNGGQPRALLTPDFDPDDAAGEELRESLTAQTGGENSLGITVLPQKWTYTPLSISPEEAQFLATRQMQRADIAALYRLDPHQVGDTTRMSNTNSEQQAIAFVSQCLRPYLSRVEVEIARKLLPRAVGKAAQFVAEFDVAEILRGDFKSVQAGYQTGVLSGWYNRNEVRRELGENPVAGLDTFLVPANMMSADRVNQPTADEKSALRNYRNAYLSLFKDAVTRICQAEPSKRDLAEITQTFAPLAESLAWLGSNSRGFDLSDNGESIKAATYPYLQSLAARAKQWKPEEAELIAGNELTIAVRSLTYNPVGISDD